MEDEDIVSRIVHHITKDFTTRARVLIPIGVTINIVGGLIVNLLHLPVYLDTIGTVLVAVLAGPWVGATTGAASNIILGLVVRPTLLPYTITTVTVGLVAGYMAKAGFFQRFWKVVVVGIVLVFAATFTVAPTTAIFFGGATGGGADIIRGTILATGEKLMAAMFRAEFLLQPVDKITVVVIAYP
ncbi:MAG: ECF transporter S component [Acidimicrobiia bacterium]|nr:ECF transporter S component [Acidimicrobiia bacterium]